MLCGVGVTGRSSGLGRHELPFTRWPPRCCAVRAGLAARCGGGRRECLLSPQRVARARLREGSPRPGRPFGGLRVMGERAPIAKAMQGGSVSANVPAGWSALRVNGCAELRHAHAERVGDQADRSPSGRSLTQLDPCEGACRDARAEGERFLSHAAIYAQAPQRSGERRIGREGTWHDAHDASTGTFRPCCQRGALDVGALTALRCAEQNTNGGRDGVSARPPGTGSENSRRARHPTETGRCLPR